MYCITAPTESPIIIDVDGDYEVNRTYPQTKLIVHWEVRILQEGGIHGRQLVLNHLYNCYHRYGPCIGVVLVECLYCLSSYICVVVRGFLYKIFV